MAVRSAHLKHAVALAENAGRSVGGVKRHSTTKVFKHTRGRDQQSEFRFLREHLTAGIFGGAFPATDSHDLTREDTGSGVVILSGNGEVEAGGRADESSSTPLVAGALAIRSALDDADSAVATAKLTGHSTRRWVDVVLDAVEAEMLQARAHPHRCACSSTAAAPRSKHVAAAKKGSVAFSGTV